MGQQGGLVPWDTRGTARDSGTPPPPQSPQSQEQPSMNSKQSENTTAHRHGQSRPSRTAALNDEQPSKTAALMYRPDVSPEILEARIRFAEKWGLRKRCILPIREPQPERGEEWSHPEAFRDCHGRIVQLCHNYGSPPPAILEMKPVGCLYREDMTSYAGHYASLREQRARTEATGGGSRFGAARHLYTEPPTPRRSARGSRGRLTA